MIYTKEVENMCPVAQGVHHGAAPIPEEAKWVQAKEVKDISGFTHYRMFGYDSLGSYGIRDFTWSYCYGSS